MEEQAELTLSSCCYNLFTTTSTTSAKRIPSPPPLPPPDWKRIKLMKNRESAARSRARKQAHTQQLEMEIALLEAENAKLRKQVEKMCVAVNGGGSSEQMTEQQSKLYRTLTAPF